MLHNFGEKKTENIKGVDCPVWQTPKYEISRNKACEMIDSNKYGLADGDFWILMNTYANGKKVMYTGLILSHNGCLKINDKLDSKDKFQAKYLTRSEANGVILYEYNDGELYEVGEASKDNCKNDYPYAMALKRCMDRVILKKSKLAFYGVYSEVEADEFRPSEPTDYANDEVRFGTYRSYIDDYFTRHPEMKQAFMQKYQLSFLDELDKFKTKDEIDQIITGMKASEVKNGNK